MIRQALHQSLQARMAAGARVQGPSGLPDLQRLDEALGRPGQGAYVVQVVGTNGKGSTTSLLAHLLMGQNQKVGWFSSPHIHRVNERIRVGSRLVDDAALNEACSRIVAQERVLGVSLTFFELLTMAALICFEQAGVEYIVLEAGLGGRLDSTRVRLSSLTLVTPIALDHQAYLGPTLTHIANEKAAVIHAAAPVLSARQDDEAMQCLQAQAQRVGASLRVVPPLDTLWRGLGASYQQQNAALALEAAELVWRNQKNQVPPWGPDCFAQWHWPGRMERCPDPRGGGVVWDVAHNPHAIAALLESIAQQSLHFDRVYWFSAVDKDKAKIRALLGTLGCAVQAVALDESKTAQTEQVSVDLARALLSADLEAQRWVLVVGSHRLVAALRPTSEQDNLHDPLQRTAFEGPS